LRPDEDAAVQLIEVSITGVRSAVITLRCREAPLVFVLFPMLHLGTKAFYRAVTDRLTGCDVVVTEGISGRSVVVAALTLAYRLPGRRHRLGLVTQHMDLAGLGVPVIRPDMTAAEFSKGWRAVPALHRALVVCLAPLAAGVFWLIGTRRMLSRYAAVDDLPGPDESRLREQAGELVELIVDHRDSLLLSALDALHGQHMTEPMTVAVVYGAGHMPAVAHHLAAAYGYRPREAEWLTVFDF
jgi:hypothetical protein